MAVVYWTYLGSVEYSDGVAVIATEWHAMLRSHWH
jgi:hypothetical protein